MAGVMSSKRVWKEEAIVTMSSSKAWVLGLVFSGAIAGVSCAHSGPPPRELIEARAAFARASSGPARQYSPARLKLARQALDAAELTYGGAPEEEVRERAYIAMRRAEAAEAEAEFVVAGQRREKALRELASMEGVHAERARAELASANQRASTEGLRANAAEQVARDEHGRANQAAMSLEVERQARAQAEAQARAALAELERQANVKRETRGLVITLSGQVLFVTNEATLLPAAKSSLDSVAAALKGVTTETGRVVIEGHTDSTGQRGYNQNLARRRAEAVRDYLVSQGAPADLFAVEGIGPDRPVANNRSPEGRANNRRVEIIVPAAAKLASERPLDTSAQSAGRVDTTSTTTTTTSGTSGTTGTTGTTGTSAPRLTPAATTGGTRSSSSYPSTIEPPPGALRTPSPGSVTPPPSPGTGTTPRVPPGSTGSAPGPGSITPPPVPGSTAPPSPGTSGAYPGSSTTTPTPAPPTTTPR